MFLIEHFDAFILTEVLYVVLASLPWPLYHRLTLFGKKEYSASINILCYIHLYILDSYLYCVQ